MKITNNEIIPISFNCANTGVTNEMYKLGTPAIGLNRADGTFEMQDGTILPQLNTNWNSAPNVVYRGAILDIYPNYSLIKDSTFNGRKVVKLEVIYIPETKYEWKAGCLITPSHLKVYVEGIKRGYDGIYYPKKHKQTFFFAQDYMFKPGDGKTLTFQPFKELCAWPHSTNTLGFSYGGGGYGEKFYVDSISVPEKFFNECLGGYITQDVLNHFKYGKEFFSDTPFMKTLGASDNWEIEVESIEYEGGYRATKAYMHKTALERLNGEGRNLCDSYKGEVHQDWKLIKL